MAKYRDLENMIEIMNIAIVRQETEEQFFLRSARDPTSDVAKQLFSEIASDIRKYRESLEARRQKLVQALDDLKATEKETLEMRRNKPKS